MTRKKTTREATTSRASVISKNQVFDTTITEMNLMGNGVAKLDTMTIFVVGGVTGDEVRAKIIKVAKTYAIARIEEIYKPSPHRIVPNCRAFPRCGGCAFRHITYAHELALKENAVRALLAKSGIDVPVSPILPSPAADGYRNKMQLPLDADGNMGFYAAHSHDIVPTADCALALAPLMDIANTIRSFLGTHAVPGVRHIYLRKGKASDEVLVCLVVKQALSADISKKLCDVLRNTHMEIVGVLENINARDTNVILGDSYRTLWGKDTIDDVLCGVTVTIGASAFYQINHDATEVLYDKVAEFAALTDGETLVDLYCGAGTIGLSVVKNRKDVRLIGVEVVPEAVENAKRNAARAKITNAAFYCGDANDAHVTEADVIIVDPPRKGCSPEVLARLLAVAPKRIVYVSCGPDTLSRDLAILTKGDAYTITAVQPVDLFPRTGHVETVVCLSRQKVDDAVHVATHTKGLQ